MAFTCGLWLPRAAKEASGVGKDAGRNQRRILCRGSGDEEGVVSEDVSNKSASPVQEEAPQPLDPTAGESSLNRSFAPSLGLDVPLLRKVSACTDAVQAMDVLEEHLDDAFVGLVDADCRMILAAALERGNIELALSVFDAMTKSSSSRTTNAVVPEPLLSLEESSSSSGGKNKRRKRRLMWPSTTIEITSSLIIQLSRILRTREAISLIDRIRSRGMPNTIEDVQFGHVVVGTSGQPLAVVQPQQGIQTAVDASTRYEYELYSGIVVDVSSESLLSEIFSRSNVAVSFFRRIGAWVPKQVGAVHTVVVETPSGQQRTFRFGTETADRPAKCGDRVTLVCSPQNSALMRNRWIPPTPPNTAPGQALMLSNHSIRSVEYLMRPPRSTASTAGFLPSWLIPAAVAFAATEAVSSMIDPLLPWAIAGATTATVATGIAGTTIILPRLKQLPDRDVEVQASRQRLLSQYTTLEGRSRRLVEECKDDIRALARLWQLLGKMGGLVGSFTFNSDDEEDLHAAEQQEREAGTSEAERLVTSALEERDSSDVGDRSSGNEALETKFNDPYQARKERVIAASSAVEARLRKRIELLERYSSVMAMIEIEVEMETDVPAAEVAGIEAAVVALEEAEDMATEWMVQASAADEVEKLLRGASGVTPMM